MNKADLIEKIADDCNMSKALTGDVISSFCTHIQKSLKKGDKVTMVGFGTWSTTKRKARMAPAYWRATRRRGRLAPG